MNRIGAVVNWKRFDTGYLVVAAVCILAIWPFVSRSSMPQATDAELHIFRLAELSRLVRGGELYPRWAPNFYYGFGYPIFNYYAPLTYYIGLAFDFLPILGPVQAVKVVFLVGFLGAGTGIYALVKEIWGARASLVASAAYVYAPYIQFVDPHARGDLAEFFSFALLPWSLWAFYRLSRRAIATNWLMAVVLVAAAILTHNLMAMVTFGLVLLWSLWQLYTGVDEVSTPSRSGAENWLLRGRLLWALALGAGVSAFFWLVVALEQDAVNLGTLVSEGGHFDFRNHFQNLAELLSVSERIDWGATEPSYRLNLGVLQWAMALAAAALLVLRRVPRARQGAFFLTASLGLVFMILPASQFLWEGTPLLPFLQFPWRLLGPAAMAIAVLAGVAASGLAGLAGGRMARWVSPVLVGLFLVSALPMTQVPPWPDTFGGTSALRVLEEELSGRWLGTTATADFVPATVEVLARPQPDVILDYRDGTPVSRVNWSTLPEGASVTFEELTPLRFRYETESSDPFRLRLFLHDFPGWTASIDDVETEIELGRPEGFVVIPVPEGQHEVTLIFESTPQRRLAAAVSLVSLMAIVGAALWLWRRPSGRLSQPTMSMEGSHSLRREVAVVSLVTLLHLLVVNPGGWLRYESGGLEAMPANRHELSVFGEQIALLGYGLSDTEPGAGEEIELTLYWKALTAVETNYQVFVHLMDENGLLVAQSDKLNPGEFPTKRWPLDKYVRDRHSIVIPADAMGEVLRLRVGLWTAEDAIRLGVADEAGRALGDSLAVPDSLIVRER